MEFQQTVKMLMFSYGDDMRPAASALGSMTKGVQDFVASFTSALKLNQPSVAKKRFFGGSRHSVGGFFAATFAQQFRSFQKYSNV